MTRRYEGGMVAISIGPMVDMMHQADRQHITKVLEDGYTQYGQYVYLTDIAKTYITRLHGGIYGRTIISVVLLITK
jgi:hypothetical protein